MADSLFNYRIGTQKLLNFLGKDNPSYRVVASYEVQLLDNIRSAESFGDTETLRHERRRILSSLSDFSLKETNRKFVSFCKPDPIQVSSISESYIEETSFREPEMCFVPKSIFIMGSPSDLDANSFEDEYPLHAISLPSYYIASTAVTNLQYAFFLVDTNYEQGPPKHWKGKFPSQQIYNHPVVCITLHDAVFFCNWLSNITQKAYRLPTEAEWEKAARGEHGLLFPWGNVWMPSFANTSELGKRSTVSVDAFQDSISPYGLLNSAGNIYEWTCSLWGMSRKEAKYIYPYTPNRDRESQNPHSNMFVVIRGGSFLKDQKYARCASRDKLLPSNIRRDLGFRLALSSLV